MDYMMLEEEQVMTLDAPYHANGHSFNVVTSDVAIQNNQKAPKHGQLMRCNICSVLIKGRNELVKHQKSEHWATAKAGTITCREPNCDFAAFQINKLTNHLREEHGLPVQVEERDFNNEAEFQAWKERFEWEDQCQFRLTSTKTSKKSRYYCCSRSGFYSPKENSKRKAKLQGSSKMNGHCIAGINTKTDENGRVSMVFTMTHYGHDKEVTHLRLAPSERLFIEQLLKTNMPIPAILAKVEAARGTDKSKPKVTKKDVLNVQYTLTNKKLDVDFTFSTPYDLWNVSDAALDLKDNIIYHKAQGVRDQDNPTLSDTDFLLCVMSQRQMNNMATFAKKGLCVEVVRGSNNGVLMAIIVVMSYATSTQKGKNAGKLTDVPLAICISNSDNITTKSAFFRAINQHCSDVCPPFLITNEWSETYDAWTQEFQHTPLKIVSPWAVSSALDASVDRHVLCTDRQTEIKAQVVALLEEPDYIEHANLLERFYRNYTNRVEYRNFIENFQANFVDKGGWAISHFAEHAESVQNFEAATSEVRPKLQTFRNKKVGRAANLLLRHYASRISYLDDKYVRRRVRGKKDAPQNVVPDQDLSLQQVFHAVLTNMFNLLNSGIHPDDADMDFVTAHLGYAEATMRRNQLPPHIVAQRERQRKINEAAQNKKMPKRKREDKNAGMTNRLVNYEALLSERSNHFPHPLKPRETNSNVMPESSGLISVHSSSDDQATDDYIKTEVVEMIEDNYECPEPYIDDSDVSVDILGDSPPYAENLSFSNETKIELLMDQHPQLAASVAEMVLEVNSHSPVRPSALRPQSSKRRTNRRC